MSKELLALVEDLNTTVVEFKAKHEQELKEIKAKGVADPLLTEQVNKINDNVIELSERIETTKAELKQVEIQAARPAFGGTGEAAEKEQALANQFFSAVRGEPVNASEGEIESVREYRPAFQGYLRRGDKGLGELQNALSVGSDPDGGYWVMPDTGGRIAQLVYETSPLRSVAAVQSIGTDALEGINDLDEAGAGWVGEQQTRSETTTPQVGKWRIPVHELHASPKTTQKLLDDSMVNVESWLEGKVARRFGRLENAAFINGDGVAKPRGFLTYASGTPSASAWDVMERVNTGVNGGFAASPTSGDVFHDVMGALKAEYLNGSVWVMNRTVLAAVRKLKDGDNNYLWERSFDASQPFQILGHQVIRMEDMPALGTGSLSIAFGNFGEGYQIVDRIGIRVLRDPFTSKGNVVFYTTKRTGGDVVNFEAIKLMNFAA